MKFIEMTDDDVIAPSIAGVAEIRRSGMHFPLQRSIG